MASLRCTVYQVPPAYRSLVVARGKEKKRDRGDSVTGSRPMVASAEWQFDATDARQEEGPLKCVHKAKMKPKVRAYSPIIGFRRHY